MKKAQDLGINTIILAAIGVLVLIILIAVFAGNMGKQNKNIGKATNGAQSVTSIISSSGFTLSQVQNEVSGKKLAECNDKLVSMGLSMLQCSPKDTGGCWNSGQKFATSTASGDSGWSGKTIYLCRTSQNS